tara:strand:+ start:4367 stop:4489 length:123 start_codon:yes stop_codon:yes gene_type:complete
MHKFKQHLVAITIGVAALLSWVSLIIELQYALVPPLLVVT